jgi:hypothetical protein
LNFVSVTPGLAKIDPDCRPTVAAECAFRYRVQKYTRFNDELPVSGKDVSQKKAHGNRGSKGKAAIPWNSYV